MYIGSADCDFCAQQGHCGGFGEELDRKRRWFRLAGAAEASGVRTASSFVLGIYDMLEMQTVSSTESSGIISRQIRINLRSRTCLFVLPTASSATPMSTRGSSTNSHNCNFWHERERQGCLLQIFHTYIGVLLLIDLLIKLFVQIACSTKSIMIVLQVHWQFISVGRNTSDWPLLQEGNSIEKVCSRMEVCCSLCWLGLSQRFKAVMTAIKWKHGTDTSANSTSSKQANVRINAHMQE